MTNKKTGKKAIFFSKREVELALSSKDLHPDIRKLFEGRLFIFDPTLICSTHKLAYSENGTCPRCLEITEKNDKFLKDRREARVLARSIIDKYRTDSPENGYDYAPDIPYEHLKQWNKDLNLYSKLNYKEISWLLTLGARDRKKWGGLGIKRVEKILALAKYLDSQPQI